MNITEEQIKKAYQDKEYLIELFPCVFEEKIEVWKWYKSVDSDGSGLIFIEKDNGANCRKI